MKKLKKFLTTVLSLTLCLSAFSGLATGCAKDDKTITVCASEVPHAQVLNGIVKSELEKEGYTLEVTVLDWTMQNSAVASGDYDANYFQHLPYLQADTSGEQLFAACKVHYEPLGIYYGKAKTGTAVTDGKSFEVCNDESNAIRAFQLLTAKGVISQDVEGTNYPVSADGNSLTFSTDTWTSVSSGVTVKLVAENLLVQSKADYDFACLPCNTAYTANVFAAERVAAEDDPVQVDEKANIIAARKNDYKNDEAYKAKIDALVKVMLSSAVSSYFAETYGGVMTCDGSSQKDLRGSIA